MKPSPSSWRGHSSKPKRTVAEMQSYLLSAVRDMAIVGKYSNWHINSTYMHGYEHPETIRLAYMFCKTLDGAKTGLTVRPNVYKKDQQKYDRRPPVWKEAEKKKGQKKTADTSNMNNLVRNPKLGPFIMDKLYNHADRGLWGTQWGKPLKDEIDRKFKERHVVDGDLTAPWLAFDAKETAKTAQDERRRAEIVLLANRTLRATDLSEEDKKLATRLLQEAQDTPENDCDRIKNHVQAVHKKHKAKIDGNSRSSRYGSGKIFCGSCRAILRLGRRACP
ncbi:RNA dependent RNA polymerase-domain-containing protein [Mycena galopus ATCC 62051]|nr:RNA dependent RNA polymerase-domain-containing protein [Mycena galopus ATCC 62051]